MLGPSKCKSAAAFAGGLFCRPRSTAAHAKVVNGVRHERGPYGRVTDADVHHFRSLLGEPNVLTGARNVGPYNVDYMRHHVCGKLRFSVRL